MYEGIFENDHIREFPDFAMDGVNTPDLSAIRTRTPLCAGRGAQFRLQSHRFIDLQYFCFVRVSQNRLSQTVNIVFWVSQALP